MQKEFENKWEEYKDILISIINNKGKCNRLYCDMGCPLQIGKQTLDQKKILMNTH